MDGLTWLRSLVYERDKHDAGWGACDPVGIMYVRGHTCLLTPRARRSGSVQHISRRGDGHGWAAADGSSHGNGNSNGTEHVGGFGASDGYGGGRGNGHGNGHDGGYGNGGGYYDGEGYGSGYNTSYGYGGERLWRT